MIMAQMKVLGGITHSAEGWLRTIVAVKSKREAAEILDVSLGYINRYWAETGNQEEVETAMSAPGTAFVKPLDSKQPFRIAKID